MTALMCDLVVAEESTHIWNPSLRHTGTGGEIMMLPWDLGVRRTKELLWTGDPLDVHDPPRRAWHLPLFQRHEKAPLPTCCFCDPAAI